jgi:hypothetical protein
MRLLALLTLALLLQNPDEPYPGQGSHQPPPDGWFCEHQNYTLTVPEAHACNCERGCDANGAVVEDKTCTVYCHADHCHCGMANKQGCK